MTQVTTRKIVEGPSHLVLRIGLLSDGVSGELDDYVILSPTELNPPRLANAPAFRIMQIWWGLVWFDATFKFGGLTPRPVWTVTRDNDSHIDFRSFGGLLDYAEIPPADYDGKLLLSTNGFAAAGSQGSIIIELRKTNAP